MAFKKISDTECFVLLIANVWNPKELFWEIDKHTDPFQCEIVKLKKSQLMSIGGIIKTEYYTELNENNEPVVEIESENGELEYSNNFFNQFFDYIENNHVKPYKFIASKELVPV